MCCLVVLLLCSAGLLSALVDQDEHRVARGAARQSANKWPNTIPYAINNGYKPAQKEIIRAGVKSIMENTCVNFVEDSGPGQKLEYISLGTTECSSKVGDTRNWGEVYPGNHTVILGDNCINVGTIQHETTHALGFDHTQNRPDRDEYLTVEYENLRNPELKKNYEKIPLANYVDYGIPYEYASRMHYQAGANGKGGKLVLVPQDLDYVQSMGVSKVHTFYDWKMINVRYNCGGNCTEKIDCKNGGYRHPRDCNKCKCTDFHDGQLCEIDRNVLNLEPGKSETLTHMNNEFADDEDTNNWDNYIKDPVRVIKAPENHRIRVTIEKIKNVFFDVLQNCEVFAVEIADGNLALTGKKYCHQKDTGHTFVSKSNVIGYRAYSIHGSPFQSVLTFSVEPESNQPTTD